MVVAVDADDDDDDVLASLIRSFLFPDWLLLAAGGYLERADEPVTALV